MVNTFQVEIVTPEMEVFSGKARKLFLTGLMGELEILPNHAPLLTTISPGPVWVEKESGEEESLVIFGGMLEVQPLVTTVLADTVLREGDIDENKAKLAKEQAEKAIAMQQVGMDYAEVHSQLAAAVAQLRIMRKLKEALK